MRNTRYTEEEVKNILKQYNLISLEKYINNRTFFNCEYIDTKYRVYIRLDNVLYGYKPMIWKQTNIDNLEHNMSIFLKNKFPQIKYISYQIKSKNHRHEIYVKLQCMCGKYFEVSLTKLINNYYKTLMCDDCKIKNKVTGVKKSTKRNIEILEKNGYKVIDKNKNFSYTESVLVEDKDGFRGKTSARVSELAKHFATFSIRQNKENFIHNVNLMLQKNYCGTKCIEIVDIDNAKYICECGKEMILSVHQFHYGKYRCDECTNRYSSLENKVINFLKENNIEFITQYKFNKCRDKLPLPFDFYLPRYNCCIETDGKQHYIPCFTKDSFEISKLHDNIKNKFCEDNKIKLIRIPYYEFDNDNWINYLIDFIKE